MSAINRRRFLGILGAGASVGYLYPPEIFSQTPPSHLSKEQYNKIREIKIRVRLAYSNFCLYPEDFAERLSLTLSRAYREIDTIVSFQIATSDQQQIIQTEPWVLTNFPPFKADLTEHPDNEPLNERQENDINPCVKAIVGIFSSVIGLDQREVRSLEDLFSALLETANDLDNHLTAFGEGVRERNYHKVKTSIEYILNIITSEEIRKKVIQLATSSAFVTLTEWLIKKRVPWIGLAFIIGEMLLNAFINHESINKCLTQELPQ